MLGLRQNLTEEELCELHQLHRRGWKKLSARGWLEHLKAKVRPDKSIKCQSGVHQNATDDSATVCLPI